MKYFIPIVAAVLFLFTACTSQYQATGYDDVYYSSKNQPQAPKHPLVVKSPETDISAYAPASSAQPQQEQQANTADYSNFDTTYAAGDQQYSSGSGENVDNGYNQDDYYDYAYSARLRRFHNPYVYDNYYNDYYTNSYWYDPNPWNWGMSIYMGYNWWGPSFSFGYNPWYSYPYYGFGYGYGYGYGGGYYGGYYGGYNEGCYYNSYDHNSFYYGHRGSVGSSGGGTARAENRTFGEKYEASLAGGRNNTTTNGNRGNENIAPGRGNAATTGTRNNTMDDNSNTGLARGSAVSQDARNASAGTTANPGFRGQNAGTSVVVNPTGRPGSGTQKPGVNTNQPQRRYQYVSPNRGNQNTNDNANRNNVNPGSNTQSYTSPGYNRPRSGQEYTSPKYRSTQPSGSEPNNGRGVQPVNPNSQMRSGVRSTPQPQYNRPNTSRSNENYQAPRNDNSQPARSNTYSAPSRSSSTSTPSRSNESYSPSRSSSSGSGSYSPSRSSSSGSSGSSSGSSGSSSGSSGGSSSGSGRSSSSGGRR
ncbi:MAG: hypothetical protein WCR72_03625 [Bacteroidota bacterium]